jgi:2-polyprenyl-6-methoxyphenol hydroxylase-like FAD-dependent oxidoreductase
MKIVIAESLTGKTLHSFTEAMPDFSRFSPQPDGLVSQQRAERILADRAVELGVTILFNTELESFEQDRDSVTVRLRDRATGEPAVTSARYLVAADGHKGTIRAAAGIGVHGRQRPAPASAMFASFDADLRPALDGAAAGLWHIQNAALPYGNATRSAFAAWTKPRGLSTSFRRAGPPLSVPTGSSPGGPTIPQRSPPRCTTSCTDHG